jgi:hypothetical protein
MSDTDAIGVGVYALVLVIAWALALVFPAATERYLIRPVERASRAVAWAVMDLGREIVGWFRPAPEQLSITYASDRYWPEGVAAARESIRHFNQTIAAYIAAQEEARDMDKVQGQISRSVRMPVIQWEADNDDMVTVAIDGKSRQLTVTEAEQFAYGVLAASVEARHSARAKTATDPAGTASDAAI